MQDSTDIFRCIILIMKIVGSCFMKIFVFIFMAACLHIHVVEEEGALRIIFMLFGSLSLFFLPLYHFFLFAFPIVCL